MKGKIHFGENEYLSKLVRFRCRKDMDIVGGPVALLRSLRALLCSNQQIILHISTLYFLIINPTHNLSCLQLFELCFQLSSVAR